MSLKLVLASVAGILCLLPGSASAAKDSFLEFAAPFALDANPLGLPSGSGP